MIVETDEPIEVLDDYCWLTVGQIQRLLTVDNVVNMDTRTVLSCMPFGGHPTDDVADRSGRPSTHVGSAMSDTATRCAVRWRSTRGRCTPPARWSVG